MSKDTDKHMLLSGKNGLSLGITHQLNHLPASPSNSKNKISTAFLHLWKKLLVLVWRSWAMILWLVYKLQEFSLLQMERDHLFQERFRTKTQSSYTLFSLKGLLFSHWLHRSPWKWHHREWGLPSFRVHSFPLLCLSLQGTIKRKRELDFNLCCFHVFSAIFTGNKLCLHISF